MQIWDWPHFWDYLHSPFLIGGAITTLWLTAVCAVLGVLLGFILAIARMSQIPPVVAVARIYIWLFRGTPLLVQLIIIYTGLPQFGIRLSVVASAIIGLSLNEGAYLSEIVRASIMSVPRGQRNAAMALGMKPTQAMIYVIIPQAFRIMIPPFGNAVNGLLKTTSLASAISMEELLRRTTLLIQQHFLVLELFTVASIYYLIMTTAWELVQGRLEKRYGRGFDDRTVNTEQR